MIIWAILQTNFHSTAHKGIEPRFKMSRTPFNICRLCRAFYSHHQGLRPGQTPTPNILFSSSHPSNNNRHFSSTASTTKRRLGARSMCPTQPPSVSRHAASSAAAPPDETPMTEDAAEEIQDTSKIGQRAPAYTETYIAGGTTEALFKECARQADYIIPQAFERGGDIPRTPDGEHIGEGGGFWYDST